MAIAAKDVILGFFEDLRTGNAEAAFARLAPDVDYRVMAPAPYGGTVDAQGLIAMAQNVFSKLAEPINVQVQRILTDGDHVVVEAVGQARTLKGGNYDNNYLFLYRVVDGKIVEAREFLDSAKYVSLVEGQF